MDPQLSCDICQVPFTGIDAARQHYNSPKHQTQVTNIQKAKEVGQSYSFDGEKGECYVCSVQFTSRENFHQHIDGYKHQNQERRFQSYIQSTNALDLPDDAGLSQIDDIDECKARIRAAASNDGNDPRDDIEYTFNNETKLGYCNACKVNLTSLQNASQHLTGKRHMKNKTRWERQNQGSSGVEPRPTLTSQFSVRQVPRQFPRIEPQHDQHRSRDHQLASNSSSPSDDDDLDSEQDQYRFINQRGRRNNVFPRSPADGDTGLLSHDDNPYTHQNIPTARGAADGSLNLLNTGTQSRAVVKPFERGTHRNILMSDSLNEPRSDNQLHREPQRPTNRLTPVSDEQNLLLAAEHETPLKQQGREPTNRLTPVSDEQIWRQGAKDETSMKRFYYQNITEPGSTERRFHETPLKRVSSDHRRENQNLNYENIMRPDSNEPRLHETPVKSLWEPDSLGSTRANPANVGVYGDPRLHETPVKSLWEPDSRTRANPANVGSYGDPRFHETPVKSLWEPDSLGDTRDNPANVGGYGDPRFHETPLKEFWQNDSLENQHSRSHGNRTRVTDYDRDVRTAREGTERIDIDEELSLHLSGVCIEERVSTNERNSVRPRYQDPNDTNKTQNIMAPNETSLL